MHTRYDRQIILPEIGEQGQQLLSQAKVLIVGVGGLGSPIALYLAGAGVGTLGLIDDDTVSISNLHRQVIYDETMTGLPKAECARKRLLSINSSINVCAHSHRLTKENVEEIISRYDIVVDGCDNFATRYIISDACQALAKPYVYGAICGLQGQVAVLCKGHATYRTLFPDEQQTTTLPHPGRQVAGPTPGVVGSIQALQAIFLICQSGHPLIDRLWTIDLSTMQSFEMEL